MSDLIFLEKEFGIEKISWTKEIGSKQVDLSFSDEGLSPAFYQGELEGERLKELSGRLSVLKYFELNAQSNGSAYALWLALWVEGAKNLVPEVTDWIGVYYSGRYFLGFETTDLYLGPYFGDYTDHQIIPLEKGLCGLALREKRVVNVANVHEDTRHIACSLKTNSELIIPLTNEAGEMIAELDIDCNKLGAFTPKVEETFKKYCETFKASL